MKETDSVSVESARRLSYAAEVGTIGIWDFDAINNSLHWNSVMHKLFDHPERDFNSEYLDFTDRLHPDDKERVLNSINNGVPGKTPYDIDYRVVWRDGSVHHIRARAEIYFNENNEMVRLTGICYDISSQVNYEKKLQNIALHDALTGLYNRQYLISFEKNLKKFHHDYTMLFIDLNGFKKINDSMGHQIGDRLLCLVAKKMQRQLRSTEADIIRLGGDEYLIILHGNYSNAEVDDICSHILPIINNNYLLKGRNVRISASIGISSSPKDGTRLEDVIRAADLAMYHNKSEQQHSYERFNPLLKAPRDRQLLIEEHLYSAIDRNEFKLHYQPVYNVRADNIYCLETLIRWYHPILGSISPSEFIGISEANGYIHTIDRWVIDNALKNFHNFRQHSETPLKLSINMSILLLDEHTIYDYIKEKLNQYHIEPRDLILEITESSYTRHFNSALHMLTLLSQLGINIALDDFGIEYSSLRYLQTLPVNYLKIDREFVANMACSTSCAIIDCIISLADRLDMHVIAEGVEDEAQYQQLQAMGCQLLQGNYLAPALERKQLEQQLTSLETSFPA